MQKAMKEERDLLQVMGMSAMPLDGKKPILKDWEKKSSDFLFKQIKPGQNFGIRTGKVSRCIVVDVDVKDRGLEVWTALEQKMGPIHTYRVTTGSGGLHLYFDYTQGLKNGAKRVKMAGEKVGIDLKTDCGQVVAALSIHPDTLRMYTAEVPLRQYMKDRKPDEPYFASLPDWLRSLLVGDTELDKDGNIFVPQKQEKAAAPCEVRDEIITYEFVETVVMRCCSAKRTDDYSDWQNIVFGLAHASKQYKLGLKELAHEFSKQSDIYLKKEGAKAVDDLWKAEAKESQCTLGTVRHFAKQDNPELYAEACRAISVDGDAPPTDWDDLPLVLAKQTSKKGLMKFFRGCLFEVHGATSQFYARSDNGKIVPIAQPFEARGADRPVPGLEVTCKSVLSELRSKTCWLEVNTFKRVDFMPSFTERIEVPRVLNLFTKFPVQPVEGSSPDLERIMWHIEHVLCAGNAAFFNMFLNWQASFVQNPGKKLEIMPMFLGEQGTGKSILFDKLFPIMLGDEHYQEIDDMNQLFDRFNGDQSRTLICLLNEIGTHGKDHGQSGKLKSALTRKRKTIETKGCNKYSIPDLTNFLLATNKSCPVKAEVSNRRYAGITCSSSKIGDKKYFEELERAINPDSVSRLLAVLLNHDASGWVKSDIPKTDAMETMTEMSLPAPLRFMVDCATSEVDIAKDGLIKIHSCDLYAKYTEWARDQGETAASSRIFYAEIKTMKLLPPLPVIFKKNGVRARGFSTTVEALQQAIRVCTRNPNRNFELEEIEEIDDDQDL